MLGREFQKRIGDAVKDLSAGGDKLFSQLYHETVQKIEIVSGKVLTDAGDRIVRFVDHMASEFALAKNKNMDLTSKYMGIARNLCGLIPGRGFGGTSTAGDRNSARMNGDYVLAAEAGQPVTTGDVYASDPGCMSVYARDILLQSYHEDELTDGDGEEISEDPDLQPVGVNNVDKLFPAQAPGINATINQMAVTLGSTSQEEAKFIYDYMSMFVEIMDEFCALAGRPYFYVDFKQYVSLLYAGFYARLRPDIQRIARFLQAKGSPKGMTRFQQKIGEREGILDRHIAGLLSKGKDSNNDK